jgi:hypothetical protein
LDDAGPAVLFGEGDGEDAATDLQLVDTVKGQAGGGQEARRRAEGVKVERVAVSGERGVNEETVLGWM